MDEEGSPGDPRGSANALRDIAMMDKRHPKLVRPLRTSNTKHAPWGRLRSLGDRDVPPQVFPW